MNKKVGFVHYGKRKNKKDKDLENKEDPIWSLSIRKGERISTLKWLIKANKGGEHRSGDG